MKIGYDIDLNREIQEKLRAAGVTKNYTRPINKKTDIQAFEDFLSKNPKKEIYLNNLDSIGTFTLSQLLKSLTIIERKGIELYFLNPEIAGLKIEQDLLEVLKAIVSHEGHAIVERTTKGLSIAKSEGRIGGRPTISKELIEKIDYLYSSKKQTRQQIAAELNISLGTVYKYS